MRSSNQRHAIELIRAGDPLPMDLAANLMREGVMVDAFTSKVQKHYGME